jgi:copper ion binding protein
MGELVRIPIEGMTCTSCVGHITRAVQKVDGVESVKVDLGSESAVVGFDATVTSVTVIAAAISRAGYEPRTEQAAPFVPAPSRRLLARLGLRHGGDEPATDR